MALQARRARNTAAASARSAARVILRFIESPSTSTGRSPSHSRACASSLGKRPAACARSSAAYSGPKRNICGVSARHRSERSTVSVTGGSAPPPILAVRFSVSLTRVASSPPAPGKPPPACPPTGRGYRRPEGNLRGGGPPPQIRALHRLGDRRIGAAPDPRSALQRIAHPRREQPPHGVRAEPIEETPEVGGVETRPGGVVHEDPVARARAGRERRQRPTHRVAAPLAALDRSEERRVGKEGRSRWSPYH